MPSSGLTGSTRPGRVPAAFGGLCGQPSQAQPAPLLPWPGLGAVSRPARPPCWVGTVFPGRGLDARGSWLRVGHWSWDFPFLWTELQYIYMNTSVTWEVTLRPPTPRKSPF